MYTMDSYVSKENMFATKNSQELRLLLVIDLLRFQSCVTEEASKYREPHGNNVHQFD